MDIKYLVNKIDKKIEGFKHFFENYIVKTNQSTVSTRYECPKSKNSFFYCIKTNLIIIQNKYGYAFVSEKCSDISSNSFFDEFTLYDSIKEIYNLSYETMKFLIFEELGRCEPTFIELKNNEHLFENIPNNINIVTKIGLPPIGLTTAILSFKSALSRMNKPTPPNS